MLSTMQNTITTKKPCKNAISAVSSIIRKFEYDENGDGDASKETFQFFIAQNKEDRKNCYALVSEAYRQKGYLKSGDDDSLLPYYDKQKSTLIVAAKDINNNTIGTLTIVLNITDLPCYRTFPEKTSNLKSKTLAEVTRLAIDTNYRHSKELIKGLFKYVYVYAYQVFECDHVLIEVNPRHIQYYKRYLYFTPISGPNKCARVQNAPAILSKLDYITFHKITNYSNEIKGFDRSIYKDLDSWKTELKKIKRDIIIETQTVPEQKDHFDTIIINKFRHIIGNEFVKEDLDTRLEYGRSTLESGTTPKIIIQPKNQGEVKECLALANSIKWEIHPISTGKNWGYSDACAMNDNVILLDLKRMNKITSYDNELGTIVVEPGVTQGQVAKFLKDNGDQFLMDATGAGPDTSIIGNTAERGFGHSPLGDRFANSCGYEIILANGETINTGFGNFNHSKVTNVYKWGVGPSLDGLFTQSNLGIITKMTIWLMPKPQCFKVAYFRLKENADIASFIDLLRPLRMDGTLKSVIHIGNDLRIISMSKSYPWEEMKGLTPMNLDLRNKFIKDKKVDAWSGTAGLYGSKDQVKADIKKIKNALKSFKGIKKIIFLDQKKINIISHISKQLEKFSKFKGLSDITKKIKMSFLLLKGQSPNTCIQGGLWRANSKETKKTIKSSNPLDYKSGFYWISPVLPMTGHHVISLQNLVEPIFNSFGFDFLQTLSMTNERSLNSVMTIAFDKTNKSEAIKARKCHDRVIDLLFDSGYIIYRSGNHSMGKLKARESNYQKVLESIKSALDPKNILSPGKYNM